MSLFLIMKTTLRFALLTFIAAGTLAAADLAPADKEFLSKYEPIRAALAADDLAVAKKASAALPDPEAQKLAGATDLGAARADFAALSARAVKLARTTDGYYVIHCPMANKDWVQTNKDVANPYEGKDMLTCGVVKN